MNHRHPAPRHGHGSIGACTSDVLQELNILADHGLFEDGITCLSDMVDLAELRDRQASRASPRRSLEIGCRLVFGQHRSRRRLARRARQCGTKSGRGSHAGFRHARSSSFSGSSAFGNHPSIMPVKSLVISPARHHRSCPTAAATRACDASETFDIEAGYHQAERAIRGQNESIRARECPEGRAVSGSLLCAAVQ